MPMDLFQYDCYLHFLQFWETVWVGTRLIHVLEMQIQFLRICNASRSACMSTAINKHCFMAVLDCIFSNEWTNKWSKWRGRKTKMSLCIHSYEGCELQNSRLPASMIKPPRQIVLISGASNNHSLSHNSQSPPRTPKAKQLLDVSLSVRLDKWATIPLAAAEEGRRFKWALYPVQSKTR